MSIPLDRLYHYIRDVAEEVRNDYILIYRFYPHGSKNINDLQVLSDNIGNYRLPLSHSYAQIVCNDQEPLDYDFYQNSKSIRYQRGILKECYQQGILKEISCNLRTENNNMHDKCLLLHSEKQSVNVQKYKDSHFIPVYYWAHAYIAVDWFRYATHITIQPVQVQKQFLIYNRAWTGTREYRLKFVELLQQYNLVNECQTSFNPLDPENNTHYIDHVFKNPALKPHDIQDVFPPTSARSSASADFAENDYASTRFEVVLETLFDDKRIQLTEKVLRPIACGHPFILASTPGCLKYLHEYGFKTFNGIIDESYDNEPDPVKRLEMVVDAMVQITKWSTTTQLANHIKIKEITDFNKQHFFSNEFINKITNELKCNLRSAFIELEDTNTSKTYIEDRKLFITKVPPANLIAFRDWNKKHSRDLITVLTKARNYYNVYLKALNIW
jgi:hypothetical protein